VCPKPLTESETTDIHVFSKPTRNSVCPKPSNEAEFLLVGANAAAVQQACEKSDKQKRKVQTFGLNSVNENQPKQQATRSGHIDQKNEKYI